MDFGWPNAEIGQPNAEIGWKMANGQLLFLALTGASTSVYEFDRGHHVYTTVWTPLIDEMLQVVQEDTNTHNEYAVAIAMHCWVHTKRNLSRIWIVYK